MPALPTASWNNPGLAALAEVIRQQAESQRRFQHRLMLFLQTITAFVETKDRAIGGQELRDEIVRARTRVLEVQRTVEQLAATGVAVRFARATREAVTVVDETSFGKILVQGRDAEAQLQRVAANDVAVPVGRTVYTGLLNERGTYESDVFDAKIFSRWGSAEVRAQGAFDLFARSGNVDNPDRMPYQETVNVSIQPPYVNGFAFFPTPAGKRVVLCTLTPARADRAGDDLVKLGLAQVQRGQKAAGLKLVDEGMAKGNFKPLEQNFAKWDIT